MTQLALALPRPAPRIVQLPLRGPPHWHPSGARNAIWRAIPEGGNHIVIVGGNDRELEELAASIRREARALGATQERP